MPELTCDRKIFSVHISYYINNIAMSNTFYNTLLNFILRGNSFVQSSVRAIHLVYYSYQVDAKILISVRIYNTMQILTFKSLSSEKVSTMIPNMMLRPIVVMKMKKET